MGLHLWESVGQITYNYARAADRFSWCPVTSWAKSIAGLVSVPEASVSTSSDTFQHGITSFRPIVTGLQRSSRDANERNEAPAAKSKLTAGLHSHQTKR
jgi:hypothetical protein